MPDALAVDVQGLAKLVERRGKAFAITELVQNAWDEDVQVVDVTLRYVGRGKAELKVVDDSPEGFRDLSHAFTLFADSYKKDDPEKRGRFNLGEKLVIALSDSVTIVTTKGGVKIDVKNNKRTSLKTKRDAGTSFAASLRMTEEEVEEAKAAFFTLIAPPDIQTFLNGSSLPKRKSIHAFMTTLATEAADSDGYLRPTRRKASVEIYEPQDGEKASIYELGIPVVETGDRYHVNVMQKVPLNTDRDNVTPAYLRDLRALVLNETVHLLTSEDASKTWINSALEDDLIEPEAIEAVLTKRFGEKRVLFDPSDQEANKRAASEGYTVIPGRALSKEAWDHVKAANAVLPAGKVTPSPNPNGDDHGDPRKMIPEEKWTDGMRLVYDFSMMVGREILDREIAVEFTSDVTWPYLATYGGRRLTFNKGRLGKQWFEQGITGEVISLVIHEYGHEYETDHLSRNYYDALTYIGAELTLLALRKPEVFAPYGLVEAVLA